MPDVGRLGARRVLPRFLACEVHLLFYIHSAGSLELRFDTDGGAQQERFVDDSPAPASDPRRRPSAEGRPRRAFVARSGGATRPLDFMATSRGLRGGGSELRARHYALDRRRPLR
jgi:hypothetical protein